MGLAEDLAEVNVSGIVVCGSSAYAGLGVGLDRYNANDADLYAGNGNSGGSRVQISALFKSVLPMGYHVLYAVEYIMTGTTFYGSPGTPAGTGMMGLGRVG